MKKIHYREWDIESPRYWGLLAVLAAIVAVGGFATLYMEHEGHWVTGMTNQIVWGTPHVFAIFLIVAASGALNVASIGSVFGQKMYKPLARLSGLMAITLLVGGLIVLVLDLGQPGRLIVAMTTYNFKSIFAWNIYLYVGFIAIVAVYLFTMMERKANDYSKGLGVVAFIWRLALTTGTGSIFGFLVARQGYDAAIMAPMFIIMSFAYGLALYLLVLMFAFNSEGRPLGDKVLRRLKNLLGVFVAAVFYFTLVYHLTNLYGTENHEFEAFILRDGGVYTWTFWIGWVLLGMLVPMGILFHPALGTQRGAITIAALLVVLGGLSAIYVIVIGGQAFPLNMFPGHTIIESGYFDGVNGAARHYSPSLPEFLLGIGGFALAILATFVGVRLLQFLPASLSDEAVDPHSAN
ncbi:MAG: polysulfide reductase NrfD [Chromatiaceae bacterium]|nr:polysulfide reductase NrfD [Gammaproteobacteria bacterium]MCP5305999.1 polysulfide reductase NrfD [Chromatiaceae bacterium]MCP5312859.1 polysulfide reductase NrfD [Chromatiaceae bacterium]